MVYARTTELQQPSVNLPVGVVSASYMCWNKYVDPTACRFTHKLARPRQKNCVRSLLLHFCGILKSKYTPSPNRIDLLSGRCRYYPPEVVASATSVGTVSFNFHLLMYVYVLKN